MQEGGGIDWSLVTASCILGLDTGGRVMEGQGEPELSGAFKEDFEGVLDEVGDFRGDFEQDMEGDLVMSRSGLVQVWFSLQPKFNSFELDSEVGRLVLGYIQTLF